MAEKTKDQKKRRVIEVIRFLKETYPDATCALFHRNAFELLCATILSAQCTDERVNKVTPALFAAYPDAPAMAHASVSHMEKLIGSVNFFRNKAKALIACSQALVENHSGEVPGNMDDLVKLRGVGRKTANVVLGNAFGVPGLVVDTHVGRLSRRLGFTEKLDPEEVESELMDLVPREDWTIYAHLLISHGRARCLARKPQCKLCEVSALCPKTGVEKT